LKTCGRKAGRCDILVAPKPIGAAESRTSKMMVSKRLRYFENRSSQPAASAGVMLSRATRMASSNASGNEDADDMLEEDFAVGGGVDGHASRPSIAEERPDDGPRGRLGVS
jgi:hypothetical protein